MPALLDTKISALTALLGASLSGSDLLPIVDTSAVLTKSITVQELLTGILGSASITGATETTNNPLLDHAQTWNDAGVAFTGWKLNVTDAASAAASLLMDLQVGGVSKFAVSKAGQLSVQNAGFVFSELPFVAGISTDANAIRFSWLGVNSLAFNQDFIIGSSTISPNSALSFNHDVGGDLKILRDAANILAQRNAANAQIYRLYNTFTDAANYERLGFNWAANALTILNENAGTGVLRDLILRGILQTYDTTVAALPAAAAGNKGQRRHVTDATAPAFLATVAGGGAVVTPVFSDGTNWIVG